MGILVRSTRSIGLLLLAATATTLPIGAAGAQDPSAQEPSKGANSIQGECRSSDKSKGCNRCEAALERAGGVALPATGGSLTWSCPTMAAGTYDLDMSIPVKLMPVQKLDSKIFFQANASFSVLAHTAGKAGQTQVLLRTEPLSWSWWSRTGMIIDRTDRIRITRRATVEIVVKLDDARYYVPEQVQGIAYRDGRLSIDKGAVMRLVPPPVSKTAAAPAPGAP